MLGMLSRGGRRTLLPLAFMAGAACEREDIGTNPYDFSTTRNFVTGEAEAAVGVDGKFIFPDSLTHPQNELSREQAQKIAVGYVRLFGRFHVDRWEEESGRRVALAELVVCDRAHYALSAYSIPPQAPRQIRRQFGNRWVMSMCDARGVPVVALSFSPEATDLFAGDTLGRMAVPDAMFFHAGIPSRVRSTVPLSPENAAAEASRFASVRVNQIPVLVRPTWPASDLLSRWRTNLEAPVAIIARTDVDGPSLMADEVFVGFGETFGATGVLGAFGTVQPEDFRVMDSAGGEWVLEVRDSRPINWIRRWGVK